MPPPAHRTHTSFHHFYRIFLKINNSLCAIKYTTFNAFFGPWDKYNFIASLIDNLTNNKTYIVTNDVLISPTYVPNLANASLDLLIDKEKGIWHLANDGEATWAELAKTVTSKLNLDSALIHEIPEQAYIKLSK